MSEDFPFKTMAEVQEYLRSLKGNVPDDLYEAVEFVLGMRPNDGTSRPLLLNGETTYIDSYIAPLVEDLNRRYIRTLASCSGLKEEHPEGIYRPSQGYLSILYSDMLFRYLGETIGHFPGLFVEVGEAYFEKSVSIRLVADDDITLKALWSVVQQALSEYVMSSDIGV